MFMENTNVAKYVFGALSFVFVLLIGFGGYVFGKQEGMRMMHEDMIEQEKPNISKRENATDHSHMTMDQMTEDLVGKTGDSFDKAFIEMMIVHHQGAVDMAVLIPENAKHDELKQLGRDIVEAQSREISMMKQWLRDWGYEEQIETLPQSKPGHDMRHDFE